MNKFVVILLAFALQPAAPSVQQIDLAERLATNKIRVVNRTQAAMWAINHGSTTPVSDGDS